MRCSNNLQGKHKPCGSGLGPGGVPTKAVCQSTEMLNVTASSRVSPLPHWMVAGRSDFDQGTQFALKLLLVAQI